MNIEDQEIKQILDIERYRNEDGYVENINLLPDEMAKLFDYITNLQKEIERLTDLCNKYEEEHKTTFETWKKDIKENELLHSIIKEVREILNQDKASASFNAAERIALEILDKVKEK